MIIVMQGQGDVRTCAALVVHDTGGCISHAKPVARCLFHQLVELRVPVLSRLSAMPCAMRSHEVPWEPEQVTPAYSNLSAYCSMLCR